MNKNLQDISEVSSVTELIERCDGMRKDGTCGNGCNVENHNKPCVGKKCPYRFGEYYHKTGGGYVQPGSVLPKHVASTKAAVETAVAVVGASTYQQRVSDQYAAIETAKDNLLRECVKFGALLLEVSYYLGSTQGKKGEGLQAWLSENCPQINYKTAMGYKRMGEMAVTKLGGGSQAVAVLQDKTEVIPPGEDAPIEVESKFIEKRDELFSEVKSRRELEQTYFKFMASEGRRGPGRPKGTGAGTVEYKKKSTMECAVEAVWPIVQHLLKHRGEMFTAYKILPDEKLTEFRDTLTEHVKAIEAVLAGREN